MCLIMLEKKTYKNYKEICAAMDWKVTSGESKKSQLKDLERYCKYHKEGQKFIRKIPRCSVGFSIFILQKFRFSEEMRASRRQIFQICRVP